MTNVAALPSIPSVGSIKSIPCGTMTVVCAWCTPPREFARKCCTPAHDGKITHGICPRCRAQFNQDYGLEPESKP